MSRIVYVNGEYLPEEEAKVSVFDRGFLMADAVYEVCSVLDGKLLEFEGHITQATLVPCSKLRVQRPVRGSSFASASGRPRRFIPKSAGCGAKMGRRR